MYRWAGTAQLLHGVAIGHGKRLAGRRPVPRTAKRLSCKALQGGVAGRPPPPCPPPSSPPPPLRSPPHTHTHIPSIICVRHLLATSSVTSSLRSFAPPPSPCPPPPHPTTHMRPRGRACSFPLGPLPPPPPQELPAGARLLQHRPRLLRLRVGLQRGQPQLLHAGGAILQAHHRHGVRRHTQRSLQLGGWGGSAGSTRRNPQAARLPLP